MTQASTLLALAEKLTKARREKLLAVCRTNGGGLHIKCRIREDGTAEPVNAALRWLYENHLIQGKAGGYSTVVHTRLGWQLAALATRPHAPRLAACRPRHSDRGDGIVSDLGVFVGVALGTREISGLGFDVQVSIKISTASADEAIGRAVQGLDEGYKTSKQTSLLLPMDYLKSVVRQSPPALITRSVIVHSVTQADKKL